MIADLVKFDESPEDSVHAGVGRFDYRVGTAPTNLTILAQMRSALSLDAPYRIAIMFSFILDLEHASVGGTQDEIAIIAYHPIFTTFSVESRTGCAFVCLDCVALVT